MTLSPEVVKRDLADLPHEVSSYHHSALEVTGVQFLVVCLHSTPVRSEDSVRLQSLSALRVRHLEAAYRCWRTWWRSCRHVRQSSFSAYHSALPLCAKSSVHPVFGQLMSRSTSPWTYTVSVCTSLSTGCSDCSASHWGAGCRSFRRAAAAGGSLKRGVVNRLLKVLSRGVLSYLTDHTVQPSQTSHVPVPS